MSTGSTAGEREELLEVLKDKERRHHLASVVTKRGLAEQIREIRLARGWTQSELARATDKVQETISQLENPDYGSYTIKTLQRLAEAFDVKLTVRFDPFSELVRWMTDLSPDDLAVPDFEHDPGLCFTTDRVETTLTTQAVVPFLNQDVLTPRTSHLVVLPPLEPSLAVGSLPSSSTAGIASTPILSYTPQPYLERMNNG